MVSFNYIYELPFFRNSRGIAGAALRGWQFAGLGAVQSGMAYTVTTSGVDPAGLGNLGSSASSGRPDMVCNPNQGQPNAYGSSAQGLQWFDKGCFVNVPSGVVRPGNAGRGTVRGPGFVNMDVTLSKNFNLAADGRVKLQVRMETFNTFNLVNPSGFASLNVTSTQFGQISSFRAPRRAQIAAKIDF